MIFPEEIKLKTIHRSDLKGVLVPPRFPGGYFMCYCWLWFVALYLHIMSSAVHQLCCLRGPSAGQLSHILDESGSKWKWWWWWHLAHCRV